MRNKAFILYTWKHKKAFLKLEKELLHKNTLRGYLHDIDKLLIYNFTSYQNTQKLHKKIAKHHIENCKTRKDYIQMIIDWESARYTKPDKPLSARDFLNDQYRNHPKYDYISSLLKEFGL